MYIYTYIYSYIDIYIHTYIYKYTHIVHTYIFIYLYTFINTCMHIYADILLHNRYVQKHAILTQTLSFSLSHLQTLFYNAMQFAIRCSEKK